MLRQQKKIPGRPDSCSSKSGSSPCPITLLRIFELEVCRISILSCEESNLVRKPWNEKNHKVELNLCCVIVEFRSRSVVVVTKIPSDHHPKYIDASSCRACCQIGKGAGVRCPLTSLAGAEHALPTHSKQRWMSRYESSWKIGVIFLVNTSMKSSGIRGCERP
ncbi:hypothetical protein BJX62DRAFT_113069 [Aspergillus germanicus]